MKFKVGDKVKLKKGLVHMNNYMTESDYNCHYVSNMHFNGVRTIIKIDDHFNTICFDEHDFAWDYSSDMLEKVEEKQMTKDDLKIGYVVKRRDGEFRMVMPSTKGVSFVKRNNNLHLDNYNDDFKYYININNNCYDIMEVYGFSWNTTKLLTVSSEDRELLWKREEAKKSEEIEEVKEFTISELEAIVGYKFKAFVMDLLNKAELEEIEIKIVKEK